MLSPKYKRIAERLRELADEGRNVARLERPSRNVGSFIQDADKIAAESWLTKVENVIRNAFGEGSAHHDRLTYHAKGGVSKAYEVFPIVGILEAALDDLNNGFLSSQEFLIASEVFDSLLEQAKHLIEAGYKDPAAVLVRVVLEDTLRRIARSEGLDSTRKASVLNDELRSIGHYSQPQWRLVQAWLDVGNAAAHGDFGAYSHDDVVRLIDDVERFIASELSG